MARGPRYKVKHRRRREGKTNYYKRYKMALSRRIRAAVRRTLNYIVVQIIRMAPEGDYTLAAAHSKELVKYFGWKGATDNTPAAYLTGLLAGIRAKNKGITSVIMDIGLQSPVKGSRVFAALKGLIDSGLEIPYSPEILPGDERIRGEHIASYASTLREENPEEYERKFSRYLKRGLPPEELPKHFEEVKEKILNASGGVVE